MTVVDGPSGDVVSRQGTPGTFKRRWKIFGRWVRDPGVADTGVNRIIGNVGPIPLKKK